MTEQKNGSDRRMGPAGSETWHAMLDSAENILRDEGHVGLTSRRIAERIGVKQRLVYYYFRTMDELIVAMFRRSSERDIKQLREIAASSKPLRELWQISSYAHDARLTSEYMALANRIPDLREEVIRFIEESRTIQMQAIAAAIRKRRKKAGMTPAGLALVAASIGLSLHREQQLGVRLGHDDVMLVFEEFLDSLEPEEK